MRTYVTVGDKPGVFFFSLDAGNPLAVGAARTLLNLPYYSATMASRPRGGRSTASAHAVGARSRSSPPAIARSGRCRRAPGTLEYFLTERYCLYAVDRRLQRSGWTFIIRRGRCSRRSGDYANTMADAAGIRLPSMAPLLHFAKRHDMVCWAPSRRSVGR